MCGRDLTRNVGDIDPADLAKAIGVSNYALDQIDELAAATGVKPSVNQIRWSPSLYDRAVASGWSSAA